MNTETIEEFHNAVHVGDVPTVQVMLAMNPALATSQDEYGFQPVHLLDMYFEEEILDLLLGNGADINAKNDDGTTLLHIISEPDAVAIIVARGGDIEARDNRGHTPLTGQAGEPDRADILEALLAAGADRHAKSSDGQTALDIARIGEDEEAIEVLTGE